MTGLNPLISAFFSPLPIAGTADSTAGPGTAVKSPSVPINKTDVFEQGQWWKNHALPRHSLETGNVSGCNCGSCQICAARTYQQNSASQPVSPQHQETEAPASPPSVNSESSGAEQTSSPSKSDSAENNNPVVSRGIDGEPLTPPELAEIDQLQKADTKVRAHELAHLAVAGSLARGGANYEYRTGPDGHRYAVAGEVAIDTSSGSSPAETLNKMRTVRAAALAPADPSPQDRKVAAQAAVAITRAVRDISLEKIEEVKEKKVEEEQNDENSLKSASGAEQEQEKNVDNKRLMG
jgi:hypothetical protein